MEKKKKHTTPQLSVVTNSEPQKTLIGEKAGKDLKELIKAINSKSKSKNIADDSDLPPAA